MSELSPRARMVSRAGAALAAAGTAFAYINGWDLWQVLTLCALIPGIPLYVRFYIGRFSRYRFLVVAVLELSFQDSIVATLVDIDDFACESNE